MRGCQPALMISSSSDSRTEMSSSTTNTMPLLSAMEIPSTLSLPGSQRRVDGFEQRSVAKWLEQACHGAGCKESRQKRRVGSAGDEDGRDGLAQSYQFL